MNSRPLSNEWAVPFRSSPFRLRFELGGETFGVETVPRFVQAFDRAREISRDAFRTSTCVLAIVGSWPESLHDFFAPGAEGFDALSGAGFAASPISEWSGIHPMWGDPDDDEDKCLAQWRMFDLTDRLNDQDVIIWCAVAHEMAVRPKAPVVSFLADLEREILVNVYDDRGMDVVATTRDALMDVYRIHESLLLDHDRQRIRETFEPR